MAGSNGAAAGLTLHGELLTLTPYSRTIKSGAREGEKRDVVVAQVFDGKHVWDVQFWEAAEAMKLLSGHEREAVSIPVRAEVYQSRITLTGNLPK